MEPICIGNTTIYRGIVPPKGIILYHFNKENYQINLWISKCKNVFFCCSQEHPIREINNEIQYLCHLFYIIYDFCSGLNNQSHEYIFLATLLNNILEYIRVHSQNIYELSLKDLMVDRFFKSYFLAANVCGVYHLSKIKTEIIMAKKENEKMKRDVKDFFGNIENDFQKIKNILSSITFPKTKNSFSQTDTENAWKTKIISKKTVETQCSSINTKNNGTQVMSIQKCEISLQTDAIMEEKKVIQEGKKSPKKKGKKKDEDDDNFEFSLNEYLDLTKKHRDEIIQARNEGAELCKKSIVEFIRNNPIDQKTLYQIIDHCTLNNSLEAIVLFCVKNSIKSFYDGLKKSDIDFKTHKVIIPHFTFFWNKLVMPNIDNLENPIFKLLKSEWEYMESVLRSNLPDYDGKDIDITFSNCASYQLNNEYEALSFVPPFFSILLSRCRSLPLLLGMIKIFTDCDHDKIKACDFEQALKEFEMLFCVPSPLELLRTNSKNIKVDCFYTRAIYNLDIEVI